MNYLTMEPVWGDCPYTAAELDGKRLRWNLPNEVIEVDGASSSEIFATEGEDGKLSIAIRDEFDGPHRDADGNPVRISIFGVWLTPEALLMLQKSSTSEADFQAMA